MRPILVDDGVWTCNSELGVERKLKRVGYGICRQLAKLGSRYQLSFFYSVHYLAGDKATEKLVLLTMWLYCVALPYNLVCDLAMRLL